MKRIPATRVTDAPRWDLSDLFRGIDDPAISRALKRARLMAAAFRRTHLNRITTTAARPRGLSSAMRRYETILQELAKIETYAYLVFAADTVNPAHGAFLARMQEAATAVKRELMFFELALAALPARLLKQVRASPELKNYAHVLEKVLILKPHKLTEAEERLIAEKQLTGKNAFIRMYEEEFARSTYAVRLKGRTQELNEPQTLDLLYSANRSTRKAAAKAFTAGLRELLPRVTLALNTIAADKVIDDRLRQFPTPETERHIENEIPPAIVQALERAVVGSYPLVRDFYRFKRSVLALDTLYDYDRYAPVGGSKRRIPFAQAKTIVLNACHAFSPEYAAAAREFFVNHWIDAKARPGKRGGAFCYYVTPDLHPYVFLNYDGSLKGVLTLAHELGHGVHAFLARGQTALNFDWPLTMAETASVFGEMLTFRHLLRTFQDPRERFALIMQKIDEVLATVFRQIAMYRFEREFHRMRRKDGELPVATINRIWRNTQSEMFGNSVTLTADYDIWWAYISHFYYTPFYVYAYAFGELVTLALWAKYEREGGRMTEQYVALLKAGGSASPRELLRPLGIDLARPEFWSSGLSIIAELVSEAKQLYRQTNLH